MKRTNKFSLSYIFFFLYAIVSFFIGISVMQYLGFSTDSETLITSTHYLALPFLFLSYIFKKKEAVIPKKEILLILYSVFIVLFTRLLLGRSGGLSIWINILIEPIIVFTLLKSFNNAQRILLQNLILLFIIIETTVAIIEASTQTIIFASFTEGMAKELMKDMRAYSLHGHPLQNCVLVCSIATIIITSNMGIVARYIFFFFSYLSTFAFNSRISIIILSLILIYNIYKDFLCKGNKIKYKFPLLLVCSIAIFYIIKFISENELGTRLDIEISQDDGSTMARLLLIQVVFNMSFIDILLGNNLTQEILNKYSGMAAIENSILNLVFSNGLILAIPYFKFLYNKIKSFNLEKRMFKSIFIVLFILLNFNNFIITICPTIPILFITYYCQLL